MSDFVIEKLGKVNKDYTLLSPPIGKGFFASKLMFSSIYLFYFSGAFGEVRKAVHKKSGVMRAIKIINKSHTSEEEQTKLINEVNILKELVLFRNIESIIYHLSLLGSSQHYQNN